MKERKIDKKYLQSIGFTLIGNGIYENKETGVKVKRKNSGLELLHVPDRHLNSKYHGLVCGYVADVRNKGIKPKR